MKDVDQETGRDLQPEERIQSGANSAPLGGGVDEYGLIDDKVTVYEGDMSRNSRKNKHLIQDFKAVKTIPTTSILIWHSADPAEVDKAGFKYLCFVELLDLHRSIILVGHTSLERDRCDSGERSVWQFPTK